MSSALRAFLTARGGAVPWRDWMEAALYDPDEGYYTRHIGTVGRRGDFSTSATTGTKLARGVAAWIVVEWKRAGHRLPLIEAGPGDGSLHRDVLRALGWWRRTGLRTHLVERSPVLTAQQRQTLRGRRHTSWHKDMRAALAACHGRALIFSNELVDAFPVTRLQWDRAVWREVWLELDTGGAIVESLRPTPPHVSSSAMRLDWPDGQRIEVHHSWREWLGEWRDVWRAGAMLTIDYGGPPEAIYQRRPMGTVRGFRAHQRLTADELYAAMGRCDITANVNFTDLQQWGAAAVLENEACLSQREFLKIDEQGTAADYFQCLIQRPRESARRAIGN